MIKKFMFIFLVITLAVLPSLTACEDIETTPTPTSTPTATATATPTPAGPANWWDDFGEPEYGGTLNIHNGSLDSISPDPYNPWGSMTDFHFEGLFCPDWTLEPDTWLYNCGFTPDEYISGWIAEGWERTDPQTVVVKIREGIRFQDKAPVNGREVTAEDVQYSYDRMLGTGSGFTEPNMYYGSMALSAIERVVATDTYTVEFRLKTPSAIALYQVLEGYIMLSVPIIAREWVEQGDTDKWENAVGTGALMLTEFVSGTSLTFSRNPDYWGYDERYPENQLPYVDTVRNVAIPDMATTLAAMRTGKVDMIIAPRGGLSWQQGLTLAESDPDIQQGYLANPGYGIDLRCDHEPFTDINVRKALQMALDLETIAQTHYGGIVDGTPSGVMAPLYTGWVYPYEGWPQELKDEFAFRQDEARSLLADAGYPDGFETNCYASTGDDVELLEIIKYYFGEIGVDMEINTMDSAAFQTFGPSGGHDQMIFNQNTSMMFSPDMTVRYRFSQDTGANWTYNNDSYYDSLVEQFNAATTLDEAKQIYIEADEYSINNHWAVHTFQTVTPVVWQPYVKGYSGQLVLGSPWPGFFPPRLWINQAEKDSMGY